MEQAAVAWRFGGCIKDRIAFLEALMTQQIAVSDVNVD